MANRVVVGLLCALLGFAVVLQVQRTAVRGRPGHGPAG